MDGTIFIFLPNSFCNTLIIGGSITAFTREDASPEGALVTTISPVGGVNTVTATAADGHSYSAVPDVRTGIFSFPALPAGSYTLAFAQLPPYNTPGKVAVTVVAGTTTTPVLIPISHDGILRGTVRWILRDTVYTATQLRGQLSSTYVFLTGSYVTPNGGPGAYANACEIFLSIPDEDSHGKVFHGAGTYSLGPQDYPLATYRYFSVGYNGPPRSYLTPAAGTPVDTITLTRFDSQAGVLTGTFDFVADARTSVAGKITVTQGSFDLTF